MREREVVRTVSLGIRKWVLCSLAVIGAATGCHEDPNKTKIMYMPDMVDGPMTRPQRTYIDPPDHAVARSAFLYPDTAEEAEKLLKNPYAKHPAKSWFLERGAEMYGIYCAPCHGAKGRGNGAVTDVFPKPPDLTAAVYRDRKDGFFFHRITFGYGLMPGYGHATDRDERWNIILYLRSLQD